MRRRRSATPEPPGRDERLAGVRPLPPDLDERPTREDLQSPFGPRRGGQRTSLVRMIFNARK
jgi:hypothetical protein